MKALHAPTSVLDQLDCLTSGGHDWKTLILYANDSLGISTSARAFGLLNDVDCMEIAVLKIGPKTAQPGDEICKKCRKTRKKP